ncbi:ribonuclease R [Metamycoplasma neophronis]|uniref:Ribonuclease R n=1 Tax=Metamycoplasma neophronis TaxID=872983 RepID=A0ABY2Z0Z6_9BACT|nr:ribonuclease R [Metamycoplasma neophronis]TPR54082.1 ribonuclease R [Metamycoplasma neophronis]
MYSVNRNRNNKNSTFKLEASEVLKLIQNNNGLSFIEIAKSLKVPTVFNKNLTQLLNELINANKIEINRDDKYIAIYFLRTIDSNIAITNKRLGFIDFEEQEEKVSAFIPPNNLKGALDGDLLKVNLFYYFSENGDKLYKANILENLSHAKSVVVGTIDRKGNRVFFNAFDDKDRAVFEFLVTSTIPQDIKSNDLVACEVLKANTKKVVIVFKNKIGSLDDKEHVVKKIIAANDVSQSFNTDVVAHTSTIPQEVSDEEIALRHNLIDLMTVTIDGLDTKDFDDAISCFKLNNGNWKLYIHIADVSYYVKEGDPIDREALERGTSIYLPDRVIPMLPFELSNGICSLNPNVVRACLTLELEINDKGENVDVQIYPSVIKSNYRLTYNEVNDYYKHEREVPSDVSKMLDEAKELGNIMRAKKLAEGYVDFEIKEPKIIMKDNEVVDIKIREEGESEKLIEDYMVRANETVAEMMEDRGIPSIFRIHDKPSSEKLINLQELLNFANMKNIEVPFDGEPKSFGQMIAKIKEKGFDDYIKMALLRTMQKAVYSSDNIGHFGLASKAYSHFTSPIRRYPDLLLHRLIRKYIFDGEKLDEKTAEEQKQKIEEIAIKNSESEKTAMTVERDIVDVRKSEFFEKMIGQVFEATLVTIEKFGVFFNIEKYQASVLIRFEDMNDNVLKVSSFEAKGTNTSLKVGNNYNIKITSIDHEKGNINAMLV